MQAAHDASMLHSMATTVRTAGVFGLWDGITGTLLRQLSYSLVRFAAYEDFKKRLAAGSDKPPSKPQLALAGALAGAAGGLIMNRAKLGESNSNRSESSESESSESSESETRVFYFILLCFDPYYPPPLFVPSYLVLAMYRWETNIRDEETRRQRKKDLFLASVS